MVAASRTYGCSLSSTYGCSLRQLWLQEPDEQLVELLGLPSLASPRSGRAEPEPEPEPEPPQPRAIRGSRPTLPPPSAATREIVSQREAVQAQARRWRAGGGDSWSPAMDETAPAQGSQDQREAGREACSSDEMEA